jgi:hypothetical protein
MPDPQTTTPRSVFEEIAKAAHPKSKHPHYGIMEVKNIIRALTACGYVVQKNGQRLTWDDEHD